VPNRVFTSERRDPAYRSAIKPAEDTSRGASGGSFGARSWTFLRGRVHDPDRVFLRRGLRVAVVSPPLFAIVGFGLDLETAALFVSFGSFASIALADLGGPLPRRFFGYLVMTAVGAGLVALGTVVAKWLIVACLAMAVVGFVIRFVGVLGGYFKAAGFAVTLAFVLAVALPTTNSPIGERVLGWAVGGTVAAFAAVLLWPARERPKIQAAMADACSALADMLDGLDGGADHDHVAALDDRAGDAVHAAQMRFRMAPFRPAGPTVHDRALVRVLQRLPWVLDLARLTIRSTPLEAPDAALVSSCADELRHCGRALTGDDGVPLDAVIDARARHREALEATFVASPDVAAADAATRLERRFAPRALSYAVLSLATNVAVINRQPVPATADPAVVVEPRSPGEVVKRAQFTFRTHLRLESVWFRDAVRVGVALGIAIAVALIGDVPHAFWVALGTLSVLRGSALSTGYTVVQGLFGTLVGFGLAAGLVSITADDWFLWMLLPIAGFLAAYTPSAIHFMVGQASFTVFVVVLFNLLVPQGWRTGLIRLSDIALGAAVSLVVSVVFWPRGASAELRNVWKLAIAANGRYVSGAVEDRLGPPDEPAADEVLVSARRAAVAAERRASETFISFLGEQGRRRLAVSSAQEMLATSLLVNEIAGALEYVPKVPAASAPCRHAADTLKEEAGELAARFRLDGTGASIDARIEDWHRRSVDAVGGCVVASGADAAATVLGVLWTSSWLRHLWHVAERAERVDADALTATARKWWR